MITFEDFVLNFVLNIFYTKKLIELFAIFRYFCVFVIHLFKNERSMFWYTKLLKIWYNKPFNYSLFSFIAVIKKTM